MTLDEKLSQMMNAAPAIPRLEFWDSTLVSLIAWSALFRQA
jgi:hypothetical protein